jgi:hypothetical protein
VHSRRGVCPLCCLDNLELTTEHIIPSWLLRAASAETALTVVQRRTTMVLLNELTVEVCDGCNRWMNERCEQPARPILLDLMAGRPHVLSRKDQKRLATWFEKTFIMIDLINDPAMPRPNPAHAEFRQRASPRPGARYWIGQMGERVGRPPWATSNPAPPADHLLPRRSYSRALAIGDVFVKMARAPGGHVPAIYEHAWLTTFLRPMYPSFGPMTWPPPWTMDVEIARAAHEFMRPAPVGGRLAQSSYSTSFPVSRHDGEPIFDQVVALARRSNPQAGE